MADKQIMTPVSVVSNDMSSFECCRGNICLHMKTATMIIIMMMEQGTSVPNKITI